jgi:anti-sigma factor RsiW
MTHHNEYDHDVHIDAMLLRYLDGTCTAEEREQIAQNPALQQRLFNLQQLDDLVGEALHSASQITDMDLVDFAAGTLDPARALVVGQAVQRDPALNAEVHQFRALLDDDPFAPDTQPESLMSAIRQIITLVAQPAPATRSRSLHDQVLYFTGPQVTLMLRQGKVAGEDPTWTLRGVVEYQGTGALAAVVLRSDSDAHYHTLANANGVFRFTGLFAGIYHLTIVLDTYQHELHLSSLTLS